MINMQLNPLVSVIVRTSNRPDILINALESKFKGNWYIFLRLHPQLAAQMKKMPISKNSERLIDVSQASDMNELIAASDAFLTDYSSAIFESFLIKIPIHRRSVLINYLLLQGHKNLVHM